MFELALYVFWCYSYWIRMQIIFNAQVKASLITNFKCFKLLFHRKKKLLGIYVIQ